MTSEFDTGSFDSTGRRPLEPYIGVVRGSRFDCPDVSFNSFVSHPPKTLVTVTKHDRDSKTERDLSEGQGTTFGATGRGP